MIKPVQLRVFLAFFSLALLLWCNMVCAQERTHLSDEILGAEAFIDAYNKAAADSGMEIRLVKAEKIGGDAKGAAFVMKDSISYYHSPLCVDTFGDNPRLSRITTQIDVKKNGKSNLKEWNIGIERMTISLCAMRFTYKDSRAIVEQTARRALKTPAHYFGIGGTPHTYELYAKKDGKTTVYVLSADHITSDDLKSAFISLQLVAYK